MYKYFTVGDAAKIPFVISDIKHVNLEEKRGYMLSIKEHNDKFIYYKLTTDTVCVHRPILSTSTILEFI